MSAPVTSQAELDFGTVIVALFAILGLLQFDQATITTAGRVNVRLSQVV